MTERPAGTVTFLFTDMEGSTHAWEAHPDETRAALWRHDPDRDRVVDRPDDDRAGERSFGRADRPMPGKPIRPKRMLRSGGTMRSWRKASGLITA